MTAVGFDADRRKAVIDDVGANGPLSTRWMGTPDDASMAYVAQETGLHPAIVRLLPAVGNHGRSEEGARFVGEFLEVLDVDAGTPRIVQRWFAEIWGAPSDGLAARLEGTPAFGPASAIVRMVDESAATPVTPKEWRTARSVLSAASEAGGAAIPFVEPVLAMAWNLDVVPGAAADVFYGWEVSVMNDTQAKLGWRSEDQDLLRPTFEEFSKRAVEEIGAPTVGDAAWMPRYTEAMERQWSTRPDLAEVKTRFDEQYQAVGKARVDLIALARSLLLRCVKPA